ncbi:MAG: alpha-ketoglutarate-dependent dioxygenase AlkB [Chloroflexi bacterium]|uniref:Alpha-ketoglutarate-dependent dioxygenase AlkB n=1 Tax=Candidatus Chlorohelix allophototropha TaxID=3003348 RepID=A0A8T7LZ37_9CHLR|nr:alpha-ketoglutarate-dependent dioxygenase AlkB [Chloroflexota bacterium]WJW65704.1 alpha-ketoglutarate-dependent dioxygenase AlkB [Chloroflexota bacterium L227-S17]
MHLQGHFGLFDDQPLYLPLQDASVIYYESFFQEVACTRYFRELREGIEWKQEVLRMPSGNVLQPRLTAWYGEEGKSYTYSSLTLNPNKWTTALLEIKEKVESVAGMSFNSALLNLYRNEKDSVAWHSDDERELGINPVIASVSFGAIRRFRLKHKSNPALTYQLELKNGSLLLMQGTTQHYWKHCVPKETFSCGERLNITFRVIV